MFGVFAKTFMTATRQETNRWDAPAHWIQDQRKKGDKK